MKLLNNKGFAILLMVIMIVAGTLIGSHRSLSKLSNKASDIFYFGVNSDGLSIENDLKKRSELARNLVTVASPYLSQDEDVITKVSEARNLLNNTSSLSEKYNGNIALDEAVFNLYTKLEQEGITEKEELINNFSKNPTRIYTDFRSFGDTIKHDKYNDYAKEFNVLLNNFPANILSKITFIKPLELFQ